MVQFLTRFGARMGQKAHFRHNLEVSGRRAISPKFAVIAIVLETMKDNSPDCFRILAQWARICLLCPGNR